MQNNNKNNKDYIDIFTDGSYKYDKKTKIEYCGYGIYFPNEEFSNVSRSFKHGEKTNNRAELYAIYKCLKIVYKNIDKMKIKKINIFSDSDYSIKSLTVWYNSWMKNNWKNTKNKDVENQDIIKAILVKINKFSENNIKVNFEHVYSHTGKTDYKSISNDIVDKLADYGSKK